MTSHTIRRVRLAVMALLAVIVGAASWVVVGWEFAPAAGWFAAALAYDIWVWTTVIPMDAAATRDHAETEDDGRRTIEALILIANLASLAAVVLVLSQNDPDRKVAAGVLALASTCASWLLVHTAFTLHYARAYYTDLVGGIDFNERDGEDPDYRDFAYMAFSMGMTYQVSDTNITQRKLRRIALLHSLVAFVFGMFVLATTINVVMGLAA